MGTLVIALRYNYGSEAFYPVNETAKLFASLTGTKTLPPSALTVASKLGFAVECRLQNADGPIIATHSSKIAEVTA